MKSGGRDRHADKDAAALGPRSRRKRPWTLGFVLLILALGIILRSTQYFAHVDLWHDELALARNVEDRGLADLVGRPLDHSQMAPVGTLALLETCSTFLGISEAGLRFGPWLLGLAALLLFWRVAARFVGGAELVAVLALFAVSPALVWYGASLKPYGGDVAVSLFLVWLALRYLERPDDLRRGIIAGAAGGAALLLSFPAVPTAAILGALLAAAWWRRKPGRPVAPLAVLEGGWLLGCAVAGIFARRLLDPATDAYMKEFWRADFPPARPGAAVAWVIDRLHGTFAHSLVFFPPRDPVLQFVVALPLAWAVLGLVDLAVRRSLRSALLLAPLAAALSAAFARLLPFDQRLGLHATWTVLVLAALGLTAFRRILPGRWRYASGVMAGVMALPLVLIVLAEARPPYRSSAGVAPRAVLTSLADRRRPDDRLYVYTQGRHDMAFYGTRAGIGGWIQGERHFDDPRGYLREVDELRGAPRVWFFWVRLDRDEPGLIRSYLEAIGEEVERIPDEEPGHAGAVLYDLTETDRSRQVSAESFPLPDLGP